jgi:benzoate/toluate 1,2-dioxygenase beta subunit
MEGPDGGIKVFMAMVENAARVLKLAPSDVVEFLYHEARLLDERCFEEWLELFTKDAYVWVPAYSNQVYSGKEISLVRDDMETLRFRVERLRHPAVHSQVPPAQASRLISNVTLEGEGQGGDIITRSTFLMLEARLGEQRVFGGHYRHSLRWVEDGWRIASKEVRLVNSEAVHQNLGLPF